MPVPTLNTDRLTLRPWRDADRPPFAEMNADAEVMRHFPKTLTSAESDETVDRIIVHFETHGFGLWAVEEKGGCPFIGFVGLAVPRFEAHFTPCIEIGWRLAKSHWRQGYATEAARAALSFAFDELDLDEVVSMTVPANLASQGVMKKLGMTHNREEDFDHPLVADGHRLKRHVLYRIQNPSK